MKSKSKELVVNCFGHNGVIIRNPKFLFYRYDKQQIVYGDNRQPAGHREMLEWMIMNDEGIPYGKAVTWCRKHNPKLCMFSVEKNVELIFQYNEGRAGVQTFLFDMKQLS